MRFVVLVLAFLLLADQAKAADSIGAYMHSCEHALTGAEDDRSAPCVYYMAGVASVFTSHMLKWDGGQ